MQTTVQRRQRGRGFVVPLDGDSLENILGVLRNKVLSKAEPQREQTGMDEAISPGAWKGR